MYDMIALPNLTYILQLHIYDLIALPVHSRGTHLLTSLK